MCTLNKFLHACVSAVHVSLCNGERRREDGVISTISTACLMQGFVHAGEPDHPDAPDAHSYLTVPRCMSACTGNALVPSLPGYY